MTILLGGVLIFKGYSEDYLYFFSFLFFRYIYILYMGLVTIIDIHYTYFLYMLMYVSFTYPYMCCFFHLPLHVLFLSPTLTCVVSFLSLCTCFLLLVCNLLFLFHTKMPWCVLFKMFQKYRLSKSTCHKLSFCKVFQEDYIQQVNMSWVIYDFSHMFICLLWFCHGLPKEEIVKTYVFHMLGTYVTILCNWLILWQNALYLYLDRFRMCLIL